MRIRKFVAATILFGALPAFAQTEPSEPTPPKVRIIYNAVETIDFDPTVIIVDEAAKPAGMLITGHTDPEFPSMIDERVHFKRDLVKSIGASVKKSMKATEVTP